MAKKKAKVERGDSEKLLIRIHERFQVMKDADDTNRKKALEDLKFLHLPGEQWDQWQKSQRGLDRPCYEFNKLRVTVKRIVNDMRANRPQGKVRAVEDGDKDTADVIEGLCRNIWNTSDGDTVIDYASEYQVGGGMGAWRIETKYLNEASFTQDICIQPIKNPFCLYSDPAAQDPLKRDAEDWILTERIARATYENNYPGKKVVEWSDEVEFDDEEDWADDEMVRICEYWWREPVTKTIYLTRDGRVVDEEDAKLIPGEIIKTREVKCHKIMMCIASGESILDGPKEWAGTHFPFVQVYGEWVVVEGKIHWFGLTRFAKDAQRAYNTSRTAEVEAVALTPNSKFWATPEQAKGHDLHWAEAHKKLFPYMLYNPDPKAAGPPIPMPSPQVPVALIQLTQQASEEIKAVTGIYDASLGARGNETSGKAINARQQQGEIATFNYLDNLSKGIRRTWEILIDLIPKIYDTERAMRVLGVDGSEKYVKINEIVVDPATGERKTINDLSRGQFDVTVTVGPSYATQRMEAAESIRDLMQAFPPIAGVAADLLTKSLDIPLSDQISERAKLLLPPQIQQQLSDGKTPPPEAMAALQQAEQMMQQVQQHGQIVQQAAQEAQTEKADADKAKSEVQIAIANLKVQEANLAADVAQFKQLVAEQQLKMGSEQDQQAVANDREFLASQLQQSLADIQQQTAQFMTQAAGIIAEMQARGQPNIVVPPRPRIVSMKTQRVNGSLVATPIYEDQMQPPMSPMQSSMPNGG